MLPRCTGHTLTNHLVALKLHNALLKANTQKEREVNSWCAKSKGDISLNRKITPKSTQLSTTFDHITHFCSTKTHN